MGVYPKSGACEPGRKAEQRCGSLRKPMEAARPSEEAEYRTDEHLLVCLSAAPSNAKVIRAAVRMAQAFHGALTALFVETSRLRERSEADLAQLRDNLRLAEQLGAHIITVHGDNVAEQIAEYASIGAVTRVILGRSNDRRILYSKPSLVEQLIALLPTVDIYIIPDLPRPCATHRTTRSGKPVLRPVDVLKTALILCVVSGVGLWFSSLGFSEANIITVYLLGVLLISLSVDGRIYGVAASVCSVLIFNYLFTSPFYTFQFEDTGYLITFSVMFIASYITSTLTMRVREQAYQAVRKARHTEVLLETSQKFQQAEGCEAICQEAALQMYRLLDCPVLIYPVHDGGLQSPLTATEVDDIIDTYRTKREQETALWVWRHNKQAGVGTDNQQETKCMYLPVRSHDTVFAVAAVAMDRRSGVMEYYEKNLMLAMLNECALALEKNAIGESKKQIAVQAQQEQLRANLLRAISHDLRTPLTSISGNAGILLDNGTVLDEQKKLRLYTDIYDDAMWLINLVENLLSVTRIENGSMNLHIEPELIDEVLQEALLHINRKSVEHTITVQLTDDLLMAKMDSRLIIQVIINIVDNAIKYTQLGSHIRVGAKRDGGWVVLEIADDGPGIPDESKARLFEMFYTVDNRNGDSHRSLGLGLALCKSIINAHGGTITVRDNVPHGVVFAFTLPAEEVTVAS